MTSVCGAAFTGALLKGSPVDLFYKNGLNMTITCRFFSSTVALGVNKRTIHQSHCVWVLSSYSGFIPLYKDVRRNRLIGHEWLFISVCQPCDELPTCPG